MQNTEQTLYADLLYARTDRAKGYAGRTGEEVLAEMDRQIAQAERDAVVDCRQEL